MKKIYSLIAVAALVVCVAACGNKKAEGEEGAKEPAATEATAPAQEQEKSAVDQIKEEAQNAAVDVAKAGLNAATDAAKEALK